ncbi:nucleotidyltransferase family protein [Pseudophaeobacter flagellatus]|uniref:nucleotidyltransferase family protein n=1 Tax=Pseudophaeobacter flagellatus TaxID=2899119 RepID=UPI001E63D6E2|nr:nucleotidyltransferase family protein [Pseudophaeobacter flagellatus]MCD9147075.1 nucleotidyltransferase family protein [Pseudophaeobacter flagellatus]
MTNAVHPQDSPESILLFAAGFGTRMKALTQNCPKPMIAVAGQPLIDHTLTLAQAMQPRHIVANLHYLPHILAAHLSPKGVLLSQESPEVLDTGGGLRHALPLLGAAPVFTANTDVIWKGPNPFKVALDAWDPARMDALLVCIPIPRCHGRSGVGDFTRDSDGRLSRGGDLVYGGVQIVKTAGLALIEEDVFSLNLLWNDMVRDGRLFSVEYPGHWCDVGHPEGIAIAEDLIANDVV